MNLLINIKLFNLDSKDGIFMGFDPYLYKVGLEIPTILNGLYEKILQSEASPELIDRLARISPIAWTHISFTGKYNFRKSDGQIDFEEIVSLLEKQVQRNFSI